MPKPLEISTPSDREVRIVREFDAPRQLVWDCHTKPELLRRWLPAFPGWSLPTCEIDLRVGGKYRYVLKGPNGEQMGFGGTYEEVTRPERIKTRELFDEDWTGGHTLNTSDFADQGERTTVTMTILYASKEAREGATATGMTTGMESGFKLLDQLLTELKAIA
jgi:uncharacterized protein YndB with AHSA1/START domain